MHEDIALPSSTATTARQMADEIRETVDADLRILAEAAGDEPLAAADIDAATIARKALLGALRELGNALAPGLEPAADEAAAATS